jgi:Tannase and feruloyl esterase
MSGLVKSPGRVSMDSTNPDLGTFKANGGELILLEHMSDCAQSPYAAIGCFQQVQQCMGQRYVAEFARLYAAPGIAHVGSGDLPMWIRSGRLGRERPGAGRSRRRRTTGGVADRDRSRCRCADGPDGRISKPAIRKSRRVAPARADAPDAGALACPSSRRPRVRARRRAPSSQTRGRATTTHFRPPQNRRPR